MKATNKSAKAVTQIQHMFLRVKKADVFVHPKSAAGSLTDLLSRAPVDKRNIQARLNGNTTQFIFVIPSDSCWDCQINVWSEEQTLTSERV